MAQVNMTSNDKDFVFGRHSGLDFFCGRRMRTGLIRCFYSMAFKKTLLIKCMP